DGSMSMVGESSQPGNRYLEGVWEQIGQSHKVVKGRWNPTSSSYLATFPTGLFALALKELIVYIEGGAADILLEQDWSNLISLAMSTVHSKGARSLNLAKAIRDLMV